MSNPDGQSTDVSELSPEQRLEPQDTRLINAGIVTINNMETLRACVAYENANQQRVQVLRRLEQRASELRAQDD
ncbi:hypothetical protein DP107_18370 [Haloglomus irregulare]|uniref:DUF8129 domain-containing protein n=1 Tax=Haloglomus irregulare TaxID=2234134 RepID=A0A554MUE5_9EURY|nr:hypothetical protein [Haloglomus irregulare]TSD08745.1 hypothetical protein DP107_18370 [Haloglomus irregulare]